MHAPKCAGCSVVHHFGLALRRPVFLHEFRQGADWGDKIEAAKTARFVSGHFGWDVRQKVRSDDAIVFTFLRDPVDRLRSAYWYLVECERRGDWVDETYKVQGRSFDEWAHSGLPDQICRQFAASCMDHESSRVADEALLPAATRHLDTLDFVGFTDTMDADLRKLCRIARVASPEIVPVKNKVGAPSAGAAEDEVAVRDLVDRDIQLFRYAKSRAGSAR